MIVISTSLKILILLKQIVDRIYLEIWHIENRKRTRKTTENINKKASKIQGAG